MSNLHHNPAAHRPYGTARAQGATRLRVRYAECDPFGVAHHASYVAWLEQGRTELLRDAGASYAAMEQEGVYLVVTRLEVTYRRPIRYDDVIEIRTSIDSSSRVKIRHTYELALIERMGDVPDPSDPAVPPDGVLAIARTELACVDRTARPRALPEWLARHNPDAGSTNHA